MLFLCLLFILGGLLILLPHFIKNVANESEINKIQAQQKDQEELMKKVESSLDIIENPELPYEEREAELYDPKQMFFEGIEGLYDYIMFGQVEDVKQKIQFYVHLYIDENLLDCKLIPESIKLDGNTLSFNLSMEKVKDFEVKITKGKEGKIKDIIINHTL